jgi:hypothetical protein
MMDKEETQVDEARITFIEFELSNKEKVSLSLEEARSLYRQLDTLFGTPRDMYPSHGYGPWSQIKTYRF